MSKLAIRVQDLGKQYTIGVRPAKGLRRAKYNTLRDTLVEMASNPGRLLRRKDKQETIWALRDVNFEVTEGEVVGLIGRNGAGKSTLLKVLSRITEPTHGMAEIHGRVASLLEVGTGFHPELTGRENILLNGAILGMRRAEIDRKFDEIVAFSEVEQFIDTPVKRYSSGMYLRLAFAVAAHLEPEILLVDEVLAVGDADFQKKCLGKMGDVAREGRTVFFVSHRMAAIQALCPRTILMRKGTVAMDSTTPEVLREYLGYLTASAPKALADNPDRRGDGSVRLISARILDDAGRQVEKLIAGSPVTLEFGYENRAGADKVEINLGIVNHLGTAVAHFSTKVAGFPVVDLGHRGIWTCRIPKLPLPPGEYRIAISIDYRGRDVDKIPNALAFSVDSSIFFPTGRVPKIDYGAALVEHEWGHEVPSENVATSSGQTG